MVYTVRFAGGKGGRTKLEHELRRLDIVQKNSRPNHPTTCGKVERFQQTMKKWLRAQPHQPATLDRAPDPAGPLPQRVQQPASPPIPGAPRHPGSRLPRATQGHPQQRPRPRDPRPGPHRQIDQRRHRHPAHDGRLHHIGIGRTHAGTYVRLLVQDLDITIINATTGEILRELTLDPTRDYQPTGAPKGPTRK